MKREIVVFGTITFLVMDIYNDGKYSKKLKKYNKHFKILVVLFFGLSLHLFTKKHPEHTYSTVSHMNGMIKYLPINKESADLLTPILSMADKDNTIYKATTPPQVKRMHKSGNSNTRSVSGTKKKYIDLIKDQDRVFTNKVDDFKKMKGPFIKSFILHFQHVVHLHRGILTKKVLNPKSAVRLFKVPSQIGLELGPYRPLIGGKKKPI